MHCSICSGHVISSDSNIESVTVPTTVVTSLGTGITKIVASNQCVCAIFGAASELACWGKFGFEQFEGGTWEGMYYVIEPPPTGSVLTGVTGIADVAVGNKHACLLFLDGSVQCGGQNFYGGVGDGVLTDMDVETPWTTIDYGSGATVASIAVSGSLTCAILSGSNALMCHGDRQLMGGVGGGESWEPVASPAVVFSGDVASVAVGPNSVCALFATNNGVRCWGQDGSGQLGDGYGNTARTTLPLYDILFPGQLFSSLSPVLPSLPTLSMSPTGTSCSVHQPTSVLWCWGNNDAGQLGASAAISSAVVTPVSVLADVAQVSVGGHHVCAVTTSAELQCWGANGECCV